MLSVKNNFNAVMRQINDAALSCGRNPEEITLIAVSKKKKSPLFWKESMQVRHIWEKITSRKLSEK